MGAGQTVNSWARAWSLTLFLIGIFHFFPVQAADNPSINNTPPPTATVGTLYSFKFTADAGLAPLVWSATGLMSGLGVSFDGTLSGTPTSAGHFPFTVQMKDSLGRSAPSAPFTMRVSLARPPATFTSTLGSMTIARSGHTATLLLSGKVLVAGGPNASAELYDPKHEIFTSTGGMTAPRSGHTATLLADGKVLMVGGGTQTAELFDPASGTFTATGELLTPRSGQTATLLKTGKVLIAGGGTLAAELYDPSSRAFRATSNMTVARYAATATLLVSGEVLIAGGGTATAELYDPNRGKFTATGSMNEIRSGHTATLLANGTAPTNGKVLIAGSDNTAELYDPASGSFSSVGNMFYRSAAGSTATLRKDGTVLVAGGYYEVFSYPYRWYLQSEASAILFAAESEGFTTTGSLGARDGHTATELTDGSVLVTGGVNHRFCFCGRGIEFVTVLSSAELFK